MEELKITKGKCSYSSAKGCFKVKIGNLRYIDVWGNSREEAGANANLISETFNITNQTGRTPSQLLEERNELLEALSDLYNSIDSCIELTPEVMIKAQKAIEKVTK